MQHEMLTLTKHELSTLLQSRLLAGASSGSELAIQRYLFKNSQVRVAVHKTHRGGLAWSQFPSIIRRQNLQSMHKVQQWQTISICK
jgi:hypothetical protein